MGSDIVVFFNIRPPLILVSLTDFSGHAKISNSAYSHFIHKDIL